MSRSEIERPPASLTQMEVGEFVCPPLTKLSAEQVERLIAEVQSLPPDQFQATLWTIDDWLLTRQSIKKCQTMTK